MKLQFIETGVASAICNTVGISVYALGTTINAANDAFHFQVDEGCSGIRSLMAIAMLSALYGHFTQDRLWKKLAIFAAALLFAIIGNAVVWSRSLWSHACSGRTSPAALIIRSPAISPSLSRSPR